MKVLFQKILDCIQHGQKVVLATVIARKGSLPMSKRAKMLVFPDGSITGTIGGGMLEADVVREAQQVLINGTPKILEVDLTSDQIEADGLTCGGTVEIFIESFTPETSTTILHEITKICSDSSPAAIITLLNETMYQNSGTSDSSQFSNRKIVIHPDEAIAGTVGDKAIDAKIVQLALPHIGQECLELFTLDVSEQTAQKIGIFPETQLRFFLETVLSPPTAYLFGGGHISLHLSTLLRFIGFDFVVIDDRKEFATPQRFPEAKECIVHDFEQVFDILSFKPHSSYFIIVTRGHKSDLIVLEQAIQTGAKYIGMIGSKRKIALVLQQLQEQGIPQELLDNVHAPIGLEIGADTPEEIAISIAAELIKVRRNQPG
jgi:xanthine dehydrogenase accessory factor